MEYIVIILSVSLLLLIGTTIQQKKNVTDNRISIVKDLFIGKLWNERDFTIAGGLFDANFLTESIGYDVDSNWVTIHGKGPESMIHHIKWWLNVIPDVKFTITQIACNEGNVIYNWEMKGIMNGELMANSTKW